MATLVLVVTDILFILILVYISLDIFVSFAKGPSLSTSRKARKIIFRAIREYKPETGTFYDLGCGKGSFPIAVKKQFPNFTIHAIESSFIRIFISKTKAFFLKQNINFEKKDIFDVDFKNADVIYVYIGENIMPALEKKLKKELPKNSLVISNTFPFPNWKSIETRSTNSRWKGFEKIFMYVNR